MKFNELGAEIRAVLILSERVHQQFVLFFPSRSSACTLKRKRSSEIKMNARRTTSDKKRKIEEEKKKEKRNRKKKKRNRKKKM